MAGAGADGYGYEANLELATIEFYVEAEKGLKPLKWLDMGASKTVNVMPMERLARELSRIGKRLQEQYECAVARRRFAALLRVDV